MHRFGDLFLELWHLSVVIFLLNRSIKLGFHLELTFEAWSIGTKMHFLFLLV